MPDAENQVTFPQSLWRESEPIIAHAVTVLLLEVSVLLIGLLVKVLEYFFPKHEQYFHWLEVADIWLALSLLAMFGVYTLFRVGIRLWRGIKAEFPARSSPKEGV